MTLNFVDMTRRNVVEASKAAAGMKVYKIRNLPDDGYIYCAARDAGAAKSVFARAYPADWSANSGVEIASRNDLEMIATRALLAAQRFQS